MKATRPRYGRRPDLEARRLLGVEAQDAWLLLRAAAAARLRWTSRRWRSTRVRLDAGAAATRQDSKGARTPRRTVRAGRLRCWSAPPPGPLAGAGRCVGLGLSPAITLDTFATSRYFLCYWREHR